MDGRQVSNSSSNSIPKKIFIAGVLVDPLGVKENGEDVTKFFFKYLQDIIADAIQHVGSDGVIIVVLPEYSLSRTPISYERKKEILKLLLEATALYPNLILAPGTLSYYKSAGNINKISKIQSNYNKALTSRNCDSQIIEESNHLANKRKEKSDAEIPYHQNSGYLLFKDNKIKHHKSKPFNEREWLCRKKDDYIFYLGDDEPQKTIDFNGNKLDIGVSLPFLVHHFSRQS